MQTSDAINEVAAALAAAQAEMKPALKDANNPHFKSKYADLASVFEAIRTPLSKNNLAVLQDIGSEAGAVTVKTRVVHKSGQWIEFGPFSIPADKQNAHGYGSAATYVRRFALASALGVSADDDDGNAAVQSTPRREPLTDPTQVKNPAGRSGAVTKVRELCREVMACSDADQLMALLNDPENKKLAVTTCRDYPRDWMGEAENSGLAGVVMSVAQQMKCTEAETWVHKAEQVVRDSQPKQAAE